MMEVATVLGSPRREGNRDAVDGQMSIMIPELMRRFT
jgi:hypothetical protein